jgi:prepilin-type N-terminal cleavage/methylation domain-containing protein
VRGDAGFTLVEVIVALVVFVIISGATITILIEALKTVKQNSDRVMAANIARSQIEELRAMGPSRITLGLTLTRPAGTDAAFVVRTTSNWTGIDQDASACDEANPGQNYLRVHVEVSTPTLPSPEVLDTILQPDSETAIASGLATVSVHDQDGLPVSDVVVTATDASHSENNFLLTTGSDGCLFVRGLTPGGIMTVTVARSGYVSSTPTGTVDQISIVTGTVAPADFLLAPAAGLTFTRGSSDYPVPAAIPVSWQLSPTGAPIEAAVWDTPINGLWPTPGLFTAWAGSCSDADPGASSAPRQSFAFAPGGMVTATISSAPLLVRGLAASQTVTAHYVGADAGCAIGTVSLGVSDTMGRLKVGLPYGDWEFTAGGQTQQLSGPLAPAADGSAPARTVVNFTLADLDHASPTPTPTVTPTPTPTPVP